VLGQDVGGVTVGEHEVVDQVLLALLLLLLLFLESMLFTERFPVLK
jgi:hypothetical protein